MLAVDLGGTFLRCGIVDDFGEVAQLRRSRIINFLGGASSDIVWESILSEITTYAHDVAGVLHAGEPIVFAFPGPVHDGRILAAPTIVGEDRNIPDLAALLAGRTRRPVYVLNDISAAAWYLSGCLAVDRFMVVTVSSGVGAKVFDRRHPRGVLDDVPYGGKIGHCVVDHTADAPPCDCGGRGHLGAISSGRGTERLARRMAREDSARFGASACARTFGATPDTLTNELHFVPAVRAHDPWAIEVMQLAMRPLANVISATAFAVGLERVQIIGGFALELGAAYVETMSSMLAPSTRLPLLGLPADIFVGTSTVHPEACLLGAAVFGRRFEAVAR